MVIRYNLAPGFVHNSLLIGCSSPGQEKKLRPARRRQGQGQESEDFWIDVFYILIRKQHSYITLDWLSDKSEILFFTFIFNCSSESPVLAFGSTSLNSLPFLWSTNFYHFSIIHQAKLTLSIIIL